LNNQSVIAGEVKQSYKKLTRFAVKKKGCHRAAFLL